MFTVSISWSSAAGKEDEPTGHKHAPGFAQERHLLPVSAGSRPSWRQTWM